MTSAWSAIAAVQHRADPAYKDCREVSRHSAALGNQPHRGLAYPIMVSLAVEAPAQLLYQFQQFSRIIFARCFFGNHAPWVGRCATSIVHRDYDSVGGF
ncbi:MAG TPA: hypothetical protein VMB66_09660 [Candidatus Acidoferrales bacterium]|nr:hypothetical protein [Candidatus Acidoferrales bacterium]